MPTQFTRKAKLEHSFFRIRVSEEDLDRYARLIVEATKDLEGEIDITIKTPNATFNTTDAYFFTDPHMPKEICAVSLSFCPYNGPLSIKLSFDNDGISPECCLRVGGTDTRANQVFEDLRNDLEGKHVFGHWLAQKLGRSLGDSMFVGMICAAVCAVAAVSAYLSALEWWVSSSLDAAINEMAVGAELAVGAGLAIAFFGGTWAGCMTAVKYIPKYWPAVEFAGNIHDLGARNRKRFYWLAAAVFLPILNQFFGKKLIGFFMGA